MQTHDKVPPDQKNQENLAKARPGIDPKVGDFVRVIDVNAGEDACAARIDDVN